MIDEDSIHCHSIIYCILCLRRVTLLYKVYYYRLVFCKECIGEVYGRDKKQYQQDVFPIGVYVKVFIFFFLAITMSGVKKILLQF